MNTRTIRIPRTPENLAALAAHFPRTLKAFEDAPTIRLKATDAALQRLTACGVRWH